ncbi:MAG: CPBP family intramembrane metalloprotease [Ignavibacteriaceae bacterium]|nr:CPBP family intramembrane metalloprotease [Ignavibacteriaceae bacterium]
MKNEFKELILRIKSLDKKVVIIFLWVAISQTISWYFTSRRFFRINLYPSFQSDPNLFLYEYLYWFIGDFFVFFILSILLILFVFKEKPRDYGLTFGDYKSGLKISAIFLLIMLPLIWFFSSTAEFAETYPHLKSARDSLLIFFIYESGMFAYMFGWEYIWRGFMLFGLKEKFGDYSVLIQMIPFVILHNGKPFPETIGAILGGIALGILALRTRSVYYCVFTHMGIMFSIDLISTLRYKANDFGVGIESVINILKVIF